MRYILSLTLLAAITFTGGGLSAAQAAVELEAGSFEPIECWFEGPIPFLPEPEFECGYVVVPERHANPAGPTIRLPVAILRTDASDPNPDPLFLAQGGPGGDAFQIFPVIIGQSATTLKRDIVIFNQRGTNYAEPNLICNETHTAVPEILSLGGEEADKLSLQVLASCYDRLVSEDIDLSAYNSLENAADVDAIREALGYEQYNFYGVSYGSLLGMHLMRNHSEHLRSVILDGVVPPNLNFIPQVALNTNRVFDAVIESCTQSDECDAEYPDLEERFFGLVDELNKSPITLTITDSDSGKRAKAYLDGDTLVDVLFQSFYFPDSYAIFPKLVSNLEAGDYTFIRGIWPLFAFDKTSSEGMYFSVICAEDADFTTDDAAVGAIRPYFAENAATDLQTYLDVCALWQVEQLPPEVDDEVVSAIPTLLLSGYYDPITPPSFAATAANGLENSYAFVSPTGSHGVAFDNPCTNSLVTQFLLNPAVEPDASCLENMVPADFVPRDALSFQFLGEINRLTKSMWIQIGLATIFLLGTLSSFIVLPLAWLIGVIRKKDPLAHISRRRDRALKWAGGLLAMLFSVLALIFVTGILYYAFDAILNGLASIMAVSSAATPFFVIPLILVLITIILVVIVIIAWRRNQWSSWIKIYYGILALSCVGYVIVLAAGGMLTTLF